MNENSLEAYESIKPTLSNKQRFVFEALRNNPASNKTLAKRMGMDTCRITPRTLELRRCCNRCYFIHKNIDPKKILFCEKCNQKFSGLVKEMYSEKQDGYNASVWGVSL